MGAHSIESLVCEDDRDRECAVGVAAAHAEHGLHAVLHHEFASRNDGTVESVDGDIGFEDAYPAKQSQNPWAAPATDGTAIDEIRVRSSSICSQVALESSVTRAGLYHARTNGRLVELLAR